MDVFGITYIIETPQQFWSELDEILQLPPDATLDQLDGTLRRFVVFCSTYHEQYLQAPAQLEHACGLLLQSELFAFHSERMRELMLGDAEITTDPHRQLILYKILLSYGRNKPNFLRVHKKWQPLIPLLMDHVLVDFDPDAEDNYAGSVSSSGWSRAMTVPIEARLRLLAVGILYEVCRVQTFSLGDLKTFTDSFVDHLFELVEQTRHMQDETLNYSVIKLIIALNEQFMVASIQTQTPSPPPHGHRPKHSHSPPAEESNRVLRILMRRLNYSKTFGENMIFMLNRASTTMEDNVMQLLILKILFLLFTTKGTSEYFYTNDLCVLVDVFLREILDLDEQNESLRHTYLRVLHPLLTRTQLRSTPYKRQQILRTLESLVAKSAFREVNPTTRRLVERCFTGEWCALLRQQQKEESEAQARVRSPSGDSFASGGTGRSEGHVANAKAVSGGGIGGGVGTSGVSSPVASVMISGDELMKTGAGVTGSKSKARLQTLKSTRSVENLRGAKDGQHAHRHGHAHRESKSGKGQHLNLDTVVAALPQAPATAIPTQSPTSPRHPQHNNITHQRRQSHDLPSSQAQSAHDSFYHSKAMNSAPAPITVPIAHNVYSPPPPISPPSSTSNPSLSPRQSRGAAPPPPPVPLKRRKPPAVPLGRTVSGSTITSIVSSSGNRSASTSSPLSRVPPIVNSS